MRLYNFCDAKSGTALKKRSQLVALDIDEEMINVTQKKMTEVPGAKVEFAVVDVFQDGLPQGDESVDLVLLFNILHFKERRKFISESARVLKSGGRLAIIHWRTDIITPRGPLVELRPGFKEVLNASQGLGVKNIDAGEVLEPYHWGMQLFKE